MASKKDKGDSEAVRKAREQYGQCVAVVANGVEFVFRPLELDEFEDFQERAKKGKVGPVNRECCQAALIDESKLDALREAMQKAPGLAPVAAQSIMEMAFGGLEISLKKG